MQQGLLSAATQLAHPARNPARYLQFGPRGQGGKSGGGSEPDESAFSTSEVEANESGILKMDADVSRQKSSSRVVRRDSKKDKSNDDERSLAAGKKKKEPDKEDLATMACNAWRVLLDWTNRFMLFLGHLNRQFWNQCGEAVGAAAVAVHRRANGPLGGGLLPLAGSFILSTSYPSLLSMPLLIWSMIPFLTPMDWAIDPIRVSPRDEMEGGDDGRGVVHGDERFNARSLAAARKENVKNMLVASQTSGLGDGLLPDSDDDAVGDGGGGGGGEKNDTLRGNTAAAATTAQERVFIQYLREQSESALDFLNAHIRGRYRALHFAAAIYATMLLLLDYGGGRW